MNLSTRYTDLMIARTMYELRKNVKVLLLSNENREDKEVVKTVDYEVENEVESEVEMSVGGEKVENTVLGKVEKEVVLGMSKEKEKEKEDEKVEGNLLRELRYELCTKVHVLYNATETILEWERMLIKITKSIIVS